MGNYVQYEHHGNNVWAESGLKGHHRDYCLCHGCAKFKPGESGHCHIATANYEMCLKYKLVTPVWECPEFNEMKHIYLICPVRNCSATVKAAMDIYVDRLEADGHTVHYPPRDVKQINTTPDAICQAHVSAMAKVDEIHAWWDEESKGSHFDFGMAFMLNHLHGGLKFVLANAEMPTGIRTYGDYYRFLTATPGYDGRF